MKTPAAIIAGVLMVAGSALVAGALAEDDSQGGNVTGATAPPPELMKDAKAAKDAFTEGRYMDAEKIYEGMLTAAPNNAFVLENLGTVYFKERKVKLAEKALEEAVAAAPTDASSYRTLGIIYFNENRNEDSIKAFDRAMEINPKNGDAYFNLAVVFAAEEPPNKELARKYYEQAIEFGAQPDARLAKLLK
jgi:tetratricopeptide (TPR) repeat protein